MYFQGKSPFLEQGVDSSLQVGGGWEGALPASLPIWARHRTHPDRRSALSQASGAQLAGLAMTRQEQELAAPPELSGDDRS